MGADFQMTQLSAKTEAEAHKEFDEVIEQSLYDYGHAGYSGTFAECPGLTMTEHTFTTVDEARTWLLNNTEKWENARGVRVGDIIYVGAWCSS